MSNFNNIQLVPADPTTDGDAPFRSEEEGGSVIVSNITISYSTNEYLIDNS